MIGYVRNLWHEHQRKTDIKVLWPFCRRNAASLTEARETFRFRVYYKPAWSALGEDGIKRISDTLL